MTALEEVRIREISRVLDFYYASFTEYLAVTISFTETLPEEINNQIRDAFTHIARVHKATSQAGIYRESKLAISHIERANRDCLKASIIKARIELDDLIADSVFYYGFLTPSLKSGFKAMIADRKNAYVLETRGDSDQIDKLDSILRQTMDLSDKIRAHYDVAGRKKTRILRLFMRWFRPVSFIIALVIGTAIGVVLRGYLDQVVTYYFSAN